MSYCTTYARAASKTSREVKSMRSLKDRMRRDPGAGATPLPSIWLLKNTDTFAGFAHAINSYLAGVALASRHGIGLLHRPQAMAHGLGLAFSDFFESDPRGVVPPVYAPLLTVSSSALIINGQPVHLYVQPTHAAGNASTIAARIKVLPNNSALWLRKGRQAFTDDCANGIPDPVFVKAGMACSYPPEVRYTALWLRERFWRAAIVRRRRAAEADQAAVRATDGGPVRICVHVRRGDVYYLGPKTRMPHPHWVETTTVLDMLLGVRRALGRPLAPPFVKVDLFSERGWQANDTEAVRAIAPEVQIHLDSSADATIDALIQMSQADLFVMGSSGFSFWAGVFGCGVKLGERRAEALPMRHVGYASTITTRSAPFWPSAGEALQLEWARYWECRVDSRCRPRLCTADQLWKGDAAAPRPVWTESPLAKEQVSNPKAVQWTLPDLLLWPPLNVPSLNASVNYETVSSRDAALDTDDTEVDPAASGQAPFLHFRRACLSTSKHGRSRSGNRRKQTGDLHRIEACTRNLWLQNLTSFLAGRKTVPGACC